MALHTLARAGATIAIATLALTAFLLPRVALLQFEAAAEPAANPSLRASFHNGGSEAHRVWAGDAALALALALGATRVAGCRLATPRARMGALAIFASALLLLHVFVAPQVVRAPSGVDSPAGTILVSVAAGFSGAHWLAASPIPAGGMLVGLLLVAHAGWHAISRGRGSAS